MYFDPNRFPFPSSGADFFYFFFGAGSFIGCIYSFPKRALELMFTSMLVGGLTAAAMFVGLHLLFDWSQIAIFSSLWRYLFQGTTRGFVLAILVTAFVFYERGWYPRGPRHGATDLVSITASFWRLSIAAGWRLYGVVVWIVNTAYVFGVKWKRAQVEKGR